MRRRLEEVSAFVADNSPDAYQKLVDRLLASPAYAEKQAVRWLDAVRYADTAGFHGDVARPAWPYRDYVLRAFRDNKPFDVFTREQLAGDLMPNATVEQKIASAYNRMGRTSAEGGLQPKEYLAKYGAERVRTVSTNWLGTTMGCSECHNHKFDPVSDERFLCHEGILRGCEGDGSCAGFRTRCFCAEDACVPAGRERANRRFESTSSGAENELDRKADALQDERRAWEKDILARSQCGGPRLEIPDSHGGFGEERKAFRAEYRNGRERGACPPACRDNRRRWSDCCGRAESG